MIATGLAPTEALESLVIATLPAGAYTAVLETKNSPGVALFELYLLGGSTASGVVNLSTRGRVGLGDDVMIAGFILTGDNAKRVIVRAIGPSLSQSGISQPLADPELELHDGNGSLIFRNDNWRSDQEAEIVQSGMAPPAEQESAIIATLPAGNYSAVARGVGGSRGGRLGRDLRVGVTVAPGRTPSRGSERSLRNGDDITVANVERSSCRGLNGPLHC